MNWAFFLIRNPRIILGALLVATFLLLLLVTILVAPMAYLFGDKDGEKECFLTNGYGVAEAENPPAVEPCVTQVGQVTESGFSFPSGGTLSSLYGTRAGIPGLAGYEERHKHSGLDWADPCGAEVYAFAAGEITAISYSQVSGRSVTIRHSSELVTRSLHTSSFWFEKRRVEGIAGGEEVWEIDELKQVLVGDEVTPGQQIGVVDDSGPTTGCHLHFETIVNGVRINPSRVLQEVAISVDYRSQSRSNR
jgi:murein DD-endopeptidase MepM/ murein hydrolase activator NlpD